jgi:hypothetical protein
MVPTKKQNSFCTRGENMKKMLLAVVLLGFGMMVGCGDDTGKPKTTGTTAVGPAGTVHHDTTAPADTSKK